MIYNGIGEFFESHFYYNILCITVDLAIFLMWWKKFGEMQRESRFHFNLLKYVFLECLLQQPEKCKNCFVLVLRRFLQNCSLLCEMIHPRLNASFCTATKINCDFLLDFRLQNSKAMVNITKFLLPHPLHFTRAFLPKSSPVKVFHAITFYFAGLGV